MLFRSNKALPQEQVIAVHIDNGFMRKRESQSVEEALTKLGIKLKGESVLDEARTVEAEALTQRPGFDSGSFLSACLPRSLSHAFPVSLELYLSNKATKKRQNMHKKEREVLEMFPCPSPPSHFSPCVLSLQW